MKCLHWAFLLSFAFSCRFGVTEADELQQVINLRRNSTDSNASTADQGQLNNITMTENSPLSPATTTETEMNDEGRNRIRAVTSKGRL